MKVFYTEKAKKDLKYIDKKHLKTIFEKILDYSKGDDYMLNAKKIQIQNLSIYRYRVGNYRIIFEVIDRGFGEYISILRIRHRKDVYKNLI